MKRNVLPAIILTLCMLLTSCGNLFQKTLPADGTAPDTGSSTVIFTGNIGISGAFPKEIADTFTRNSSSGNPARAAFPSAPTGTTYYVEVKDTSVTPNTVVDSKSSPTLFNIDQDTGVFSLPLELNHTYTITVSLIENNDPSKPLLSDSVSQVKLTATAPVYVHDFTLNPVMDEGTGNVSLPVNVTANYSFRITKITNLKTGEDFPIVKFSVIYDGLTGSGNNVMIENTLSGTDIPAGSYAISFEVFSSLSATANQQTQTPYVSPYVDSEGTEYPVGTMRTYFTTQTINVYKNMTTDTWFNNGNLPVDQNGEFSINAATSMNNIQTVFYVDGGVAQSGNGTYAKPFKTLNEAMFCITGGIKSGKPVYIHIKDGYQETFSDRYPVRASGTTYALEDNVTLEIECWKNTIGDGKGRATILTSGSSVSPIFDLNINRTATGPTVTLRGITLSGSGATNATGINLADGNLTLENCQITGFQNTGINVTGGSLTVSGLTYITGNGTSGAISNVKLAAGKKINVGALTSNSKIGVSLADEETEAGTVFTTGFRANNASLLPSNIFASDKTDAAGNALPVGYGSADDAAKKEAALYTPGHGTITPDLGDGIRFALDRNSIWENASDTDRTLTLSIQDPSGNAVTVKDLHIKLLLAGDEIPGYDFTSSVFTIPAAVKAGYYQLKITATCNDIPQSATIDFEVFQAPLISSLSSAPTAGTIVASTADDLGTLATWVNDGSTLENVTIVLGSDVTISSDYSGIGYILIDNSMKPFSGTFDGQGHTVTIAITSEDTKQTLGLFGCIKLAHIKNVTVTGTITASGTSFVGGIAGYSSFGGNSIIENCISEVTISSQNSSFTGGLVGMVASDCTFINCINNGNITGKGSIGGIVGGKAANGGTNTVTLYNCVNNGTIEAVSSGTPGGLVGSVSDPEYKLNVTNCANTGTVTRDGTLQSEVHGNTQSTSSQTFENNMYLQNTGSGKINTDEIHAETSLSAIVARLNSWISSQSASSWTYRMWQVSADDTKIEFMD